MQKTAKNPVRWFAPAIATGTVVAAAFILYRAFSSASAEPGSLPLWSIALATVWATGGIALLRTSNRNPQNPPLKKPQWAITIMLSLGLAISSYIGGLVLTMLPLTSPWISHALNVASSVPLHITLLIALVTGAAEELFFRVGFASLWSGKSVWVIPNLLYTLVTLATGNLALTAVAPLLGLVATTAREHSRNVYAPIIVHATWTLTMVGIFPLTVTP